MRSAPPGSGRREEIGGKRGGEPGFGPLVLSGVTGGVDDYLYEVFLLNPVLLDSYDLEARLRVRDLLLRERSISFSHQYVDGGGRCVLFIHTRPLLLLP